MGYFLEMLLQRINAYLFAERIDGKRYVCGMQEHIEDDRDIQYGWIFGTPAYTPKNKVVDIQTVTVKDQASFNNCTFQSATAQKEIDEGVALSVRFLTTEARKRGRVTGNGFSSLRMAQQTLLDTGTAEQQFLQEDEQNWERYSDPSKLSYCGEMNAELHKNASFVGVSSKSEWLRALDTGRTIHTGLQWYSSYNMNGGLGFPFKLTLGKGINLGGHAVLCKGFDLSKNEYKFQNSYSVNYGDKGCFYVDIDEWHARGSYGYISVDSDMLNPASKAYENKTVKADNNPRIYLIENGKRRWFPDERTFRFYGGIFNPPSFVRISGSLLNAIPDGANMTTNIKPDISPA